MKNKCKLGQHDDRPMKRGSNRVECRTCGDVFPCRHDCEHADCMLATNRPLPDWITVAPEDVEAIVNEGLGRV